MHFSVAVGGLDSMHELQVHDALSPFGCGFKPAAAQSNALTSSTGGGIGFGAGFTSLAVVLAPGRGASQTAHFSVAEAVFFSMHVSHVHSPPPAGAAGFIPAALQLNDLGADDVEGNANPFNFGVEDDATP